MKAIHKIQNYFASADHYKRRYFMAYSILFLIITVLLYGWMLAYGKSLIWFNDSYAQHYTSYVYWGKYLRAFVKGIFTGQGVNLTEWDFALGEGNDILQTMQFYVAGDPFCYLTALCPASLMHHFYALLVLLRVFLAGITFSAMCFYISPKSGRYATLAGSLTYAFCMWNIVNITRHPFFINPLIFFPLIILGVERILREQKIKTFILAVFLSALGNFYFFYQIVLLTVIYVAVRLIFFYRKEVKKMLLTLLRIAIYSVIGTMMAGAIILPTLFAFLSDARTDIGLSMKWMYNLTYYNGLLGYVFGTNWDYWLCLSLAAPTIVAMLYILTEKKRGMLKCLLAICAVLMMIPAFGQIFNGMSYVSNRWSWAVSLLVSFILTYVWKDLLYMRRKSYQIIDLILGVCMVLMVLFEYSRTKSALANLGFTCIILLILSFSRTEEEKKDFTAFRKKSALLLAASLISVCAARFFLLSPREEGPFTTLKDNGEFNGGLHLSEIARSQAKEDGVTGVYRFVEQGTSRKWNEHTLYEVSSPGYYWSISNPATSEFLKEMEMADASDQQHWGTDNKTYIMAEGGVKYFAINNSSTCAIPYGLTPVESSLAEALNKKGYTLYRNDNALPFGYFTSNIISDTTWSGLNSMQKQEAMLQGVYAKDYSGDAASALSLNSQKLPSTVKFNSKDVSLDGNAFVVTAANSSITLEFEGVPNSETYFNIKNLNYVPSSTYQLYNGDSEMDPQNLYNPEDFTSLSANDRYNLRHSDTFFSYPGQVKLSFTTSEKSSTNFMYSTEEFSFYNNRHDFSINLGYSENAVTSVKLTFSTIGKYSFDDYSIGVLPMDQVKEQAEKLSSVSLQNENASGDLVTGTITAPEHGMLLLTVPYAKGWKAYVDGKETTLYQANIKYSALELEAGEHEIKLEYKTPFLREGMICSVVGIVAFVVITIVTGRKRKKQNKEEMQSTETQSE